MQPRVFASSDIYLCAFLIAQGALLQGVERDRGSSRARFLLHAGTLDLDALSRLYWSNHPTSLVPSALFSALKHLKGLLHSHP